MHAYMCVCAHVCMCVLDGEGSRVFNCLSTTVLEL